MKEVETVETAEDLAVETVAVETVAERRCKSRP